MRTDGSRTFTAEGAEYVNLCDVDVLFVCDRDTSLLQDIISSSHAERCGQVA